MPLLSMQPSHTVAKVVQLLKCNSSRELARMFSLSVPIWAGGYLARSSGNMRTSAVREYLDQQPNHHGYASRILPPVYIFQAPQPRNLRAAHAAFDLTHHLVFSTQQRKGFFGATIGPLPSTGYRSLPKAILLWIGSASFRITFI